MIYSPNSKDLFRYSHACAELLRIQNEVRESLPAQKYSISCWALANWVEHKYGFRKVLVALKEPKNNGRFAHWINVTPQGNIIDFKQTLGFDFGTGDYVIVDRLSLDQSRRHILPTRQVVQNYKFDPVPSDFVGKRRDDFLGWRLVLKGREEPKSWRPWINKLIQLH